jgi:SAM-dependent methyltransferase
MDPLSRFTGLAEIYARCRPTYPSAAIEHIIATAHLKHGSVVADIGCGTGISSRLFAARDFHVIGIEPNDDMRARAEAEPDPPDAPPPPSYCPGTAEATGLPEEAVQLVLSAQAFHWFRPEPTFREFHRILVPDGWVALMWNERDDADPFTAAVSAVIRTAPETEKVEGPRRQAGDVLFTTPLFVDARRVTFTHGQSLDEEGLLGRVFSASYAPREPAAAETFAAGLREVFARFQQNGTAALRYETSVYLARRAAATTDL